MQLKTFRMLLIDELREIYYSESLIHEAFRRLGRGADGEDLKHLFEQDTQKSSEHMARLEKVFEMLHENPRGGRGLSVKALLREAEDRMGEGGERHVVDAGLIMAAQRLAHWKIASYGTVHQWAALLREGEVAALLKATLEEQKITDADLSHLAEEVNVKAKVST